jgi:hypothetical protein
VAPHPATKMLNSKPIAAIHENCFTTILRKFLFSNAGLE